MLSNSKALQLTGPAHIQDIFIASHFNLNERKYDQPFSIETFIFLMTPTNLKKNEL